MNFSTLFLLRNLFSQIQKKRKVQLIFLIFISISSGIAEMISLASVVPFLSFLNNPDLMLQNQLFKNFVNKFGIYTNDQILLPLTLLFCIATIFSAIIRLTNLWLGGRLTSSIGNDLSLKCYKNILFQSYSKFIERDSSSLIATITLNMNSTINALFQIIVLINGLLVLSGLIITLLIIDKQLTLFSFGAFAITYLLVVRGTKNKLSINSKKIVISNSGILKLLQEGIASIRNLLLDRTQNFYLSEFALFDKPMRKATAQNTLLIMYPRYLVESLGILIIAMFALFLAKREGGIVNSVPILGALALAAQKIMPVFQQIYSAWGSINGNKNAINNVLDLLNERNEIDQFRSETKPFDFQESIKFDSVSFAYNKENKNVIQNISFTINKGERIGFIGKTGSGKSTIIDLISGLLSPKSGSIFVDGKEIYKNYADLISWRLNIAYVPQSIFLANRSCAENIAFGIDKKNINNERLKKSAKLANIDSLISKYKDGYDRIIGEDGINLSGGQKQRLGIARAIYKESNILIFDEATSALDKRTENLIMKSLDKLNKDITIILITHRLDTLVSCNKVFEIQDGKILKTYRDKEVQDLITKYRLN